MRPAAAGWWGSCDPLHYCEVVLCLHVTCFILDRTGEFCYLTKLLIGYDLNCECSIKLDTVKLREVPLTALAV